MAGGVGDAELVRQPVIAPVPVPGAAPGQGLLPGQQLRVALEADMQAQVLSALPYRAQYLRTLPAQPRLDPETITAPIPVPVPVPGLQYRYPAVGQESLNPATGQQPHPQQLPQVASDLVPYPNAPSREVTWLLPPPPTSVDPPTAAMGADATLGLPMQAPPLMATLTTQHQAQRSVGRGQDGTAAGPWPGLVAYPGGAPAPQGQSGMQGSVGSGVWLQPLQQPLQPGGQGTAMLLPQPPRQAPQNEAAPPAYTGQAGQWATGAVQEGTQPYQYAYQRRRQQQQQEEVVPVEWRKIPRGTWQQILPVSPSAADILEPGAIGYAGTKKLQEVVVRRQQQRYKQERRQWMQEHGEEADEGEEAGEEGARAVRGEEEGHDAAAARKGTLVPGQPGAEPDGKVLVPRQRQDAGKSGKGPNKGRVRMQGQGRTRVPEGSPRPLAVPGVIPELASIAREVAARLAPTTGWAPPPTSTRPRGSQGLAPAWGQGPAGDQGQGRGRHDWDDSTTLPAQSPQHALQADRLGIRTYTSPGGRSTRVRTAEVAQGQGRDGQGRKLSPGHAKELGRYIVNSRARRAIVDSDDDHSDVSGVLQEMDELEGREMTERERAAEAERNVQRSHKIGAWVAEMRGLSSAVARMEAAKEVSGQMLWQG